MKLISEKKTKSHSFLWLSIYPILLILSFYIAWIFLSNQNFLYQFWYDNTKLESFIEFYAPQNRFKPDFSLTNREERIRIFSEIVVSINNNGEGLEKIYFYNPDQHLLGQVLNQAEIEHLNFVAKIINIFFMISYVGFFILLMIFSLLLVRKTKMPDFKKILSTYLIATLIISLFVFIIGPDQVFIFLHELFFPKGHQWFFYYQESLMTTLMMAPDLFAYFAVTWIGFALFIFFLLSFFIIKIYAKALSTFINVKV